MKLNKNFALWLVLGLFPLAAQGQFTTSTNSDGKSVTITGYTGSGGNLVIPGTISGFTVTIIGDYAFQSVANLTSVTIPDSVIGIGHNSFAYDGETTVTIGNGVILVGVNAFYGNGSLTNITIGNGITTLLDGAFQVCPNLSAIYFGGNAPSSVDSTVFNSDPVTVYCNAGTTGWSSTLAGKPVVVIDLVPIISAEPTGETNLVGTTATFSVSVTNSVPTLQYQWQLSGTNLTAATNSTLVLTNLTLSQAGIYDVVVADSAGSVTSTPAILDVRSVLIAVNGQVAAPAMSAFASANVAIFGGYPDGFIFYTLDGSTPTIGSTLYQGPFVVSNSVVLQALDLSSNFTDTAYSDPVALQIIPGYNLQTSVVGSGTVSVNPTNAPYASNTVVTLTANPAQYWAFDHWTGDVMGSQNPVSVTMDGPLSVQAVFVQTAYQLTASTPGGGSVTVNDQIIAPATFYPTGTVVSLSATASNGWTFLGWQGDASGTNDPLTVTIDQTNNIEAIFGTVVWTNTVGGGSIVLSQPNPIPYGTTLTASAIPNVGNYFVTWSGAASGTNAPTTIAVTNVGPVIDALFTTLPAGKYSLSVVVMGNGSVAISPQQRFYSAGSNVMLSASTTNAGTTFFGWTGAASGTNTPLMVTVSSNEVVQANFGTSLTVHVAPTNLIVYAGSNAILVATATGLAPFSYQWQNSQGAIPGATNAIYTIFDAQGTNSDNYFVIVSNPFQSITSSVATVTVVYPPSISSQPISQTVLAGTSLTLAVGVEGTPPLSYQWQNGEGEIPGATNSSLIFDPAQTNETDNYSVIISNPYGVVTSTIAPVMVYLPASIIVPAPVSVVVPASAPVSFGVTASGFPAPSYQWTFNGTNLPGATANTFAINQVGLSNLGIYEVYVYNNYGSNSDTVTLYMSPSITSPFTGATAVWGTSALLSVAAIGSGQLSYQWFENGMAISGATNATFDFTSIQFTNAGAYSVVVSSPFGAVTNTAQVVVNPSTLSLGFCPALTLGGVVGYSYIIQSSSNLLDTNAWVTLTSLTLTQSVQLWVDTNVDASSPFNPKYFYRVLPAP